MTEHLNSIHLEDPRREAFRQARSRLLDACGDKTRYVIQKPGDVAEPPNSKTILENVEDRIPKGTEFALVDKEGVYPLKVGLNTIGRLPDNDVVLEDAFISRRHCAILIHTGAGSELHDVASKNGTFLNGNRLEGPMPLQSGDEIRMCDRHLVFIRQSEGRTPAAVAATLAK